MTWLSLLLTARLILEARNSVPQETAAALQDALPRAQIEVQDERIQVTGSSDEINRAKTIFYELDRPQDQVLFRAGFVTGPLDGPSQTVSAQVSDRAELLRNPSQTTTTIQLPLQNAVADTDCLQPLASCRAGRTTQCNLEEPTQTVHYDPDRSTFLTQTVVPGLRLQLTPTVQGRDIQCHVQLQRTRLQELLAGQYPHLLITTSEMDITLGHGRIVALAGLFGPESPLQKLAIPDLGSADPLLVLAADVL